MKKDQEQFTERPSKGYLNFKLICRVTVQFSRKGTSTVERLQGQMAPSDHRKTARLSRCITLCLADYHHENLAHAQKSVNSLFEPLI